MTPIGVLRLPSQIRFGFGARDSLARSVADLGSSVFIVADPFVSTSTFFSSALDQLKAASVRTKVYTEVQAELPVESLKVAAEAAREFRPEVIVGWGGGSALDAAKLVALLVAHGGAPSDYYGENAVPGTIVPLVAVPTTAGTGSEVTPVAVISDSTRELKVGISSPYLIPQAAIVDPELTLGAPGSVTAHAGIDALVHSIESLTAAELGLKFGETEPVFVGRNVIGEPLAVQAVRLIGSALERSVSAPNDRGARETMAQGSLLAGMAFGTSGTHLSHAIQYPIGALTHTPHGLGTGLMLPFVLEACCHEIGDRLRVIGTALGVEGEPHAAIDRVAAIGKNIGIPQSLAEIGVIEQDLPRIAELTLSSRRLAGISPVAADLQFIKRILQAAFAGDRSILRS